MRIPRVVARAFSHIFDVLNLTPYSIGHHELLEHDNIPKKNRLAEILGREPLEIGKTPEYQIKGNVKTVRISA